MAITITEKTAPEWFTPESETEEEQPAQFHITPLNQVQVNEVLPEVDQESGVFSGRGVQTLLRYGLRDWKNILDEQGKEVPFRYGRLTRVPFDVQQEVASRIFEISVLTEAERKNS
ncbi:MAG: hypothetical protein ACLFQ3_06630 [Thiohalorhabdus sp.]